jgi:hypothetical protein
VRSGPPAPPNGGGAFAGGAFGSSSGLSGVAVAASSSSSSSGEAGDTRAGELLVVGCLVCSYGLIGAGALHTLLVCAQDNKKTHKLFVSQEHASP